MDEDAPEDTTQPTHRYLQKSTGKEIGTASIYPKHLHIADTMNLKLEHCDALDVLKNSKTREMFMGSKESSQLQQDLYLTDSEEDEDDVCLEVDEETKKQARLVEEMIVDESENETSFDPHDDSSKSFSSTATNTNKLTMKSLYEEVEGQEDVSKRKNRKVRCKLCKLGGKVTLISLSNITKHIRDIHEEERREKCPHCDKILKLSSLGSHIRDFHKGGRSRVKCPVCNKEMKKSSLQKHVKNVHGSGKGKAHGDKQLAKSLPRSPNIDHLEEVDEEVTTFASPSVDTNSSLSRESPPRKKFKFKCDCCSKEFLLSRALMSHQKKCPPK